MCWNLFQVSPVRCWACTPGPGATQPGDLSQAFLLQSVLRTERYRNCGWYLIGNCFGKIVWWWWDRRKLINDHCWLVLAVPCQDLGKLFIVVQCLENTKLDTEPESNTTNCEIPINLFQFLRNLKGWAFTTREAQLSSFSQIYLALVSWLN